MRETKQTVIIGAGPAGLAAGFLLSSRDEKVLILEKNDQAGGLSRTIRYKGNYFDLGGHRFYTKNKRVFEWWQNMLPKDFLKVPRTSRIYYRGAYFDYPVSVLNVTFGLGVHNALFILASYLLARFFPSREEKNLEQWITNRFGKKLFETFFKDYSEKVWGIPCDRISAEWAQERIRGVSLLAALRSGLFRARGGKIKSLIKEFYFPRLGAGMMYEEAAKRFIASGGEIAYGCEVIKVRHDKQKILSVLCQDTCDTGTREIKADHFCSSMPITELLFRMDPLPRDELLRAALRLRYRSVVMVYLIINRKHVSDDNWIYVHSPEVSVSRIQNFKNWSKDMLANQNTTSLGLEYFCEEGDSFWNRSDQDLIHSAKEDIEKLKLAQRGDCIDAYVVRVPQAYPVYELGYRKNLEQLSGFVGGFSNLQCMGRYGLFHYSGMDHPIMSGFLAAENVLGARHSLWSFAMEGSDD